MATPNRYLSVFSGREIDEILASVKNKIDSSLIVNDFSGGVNKVASAELAKTLNTAIQSFKDPNYFQYLLLSIPDNNIYTTAEKNKLANITDKFVGTFQDAATRDSQLNTANYTGGELAFLIDNGEGFQEFSRWDTSTNSWKVVKLYELGTVPSITVPTASTVTLSSFDVNTSHTCKIIISAKNGLNIQAQEVMITTNGIDDWVSIYGEVGNSTSLFSVSTTLAGSTLNINVSTTVADTIISARKVVEI